MRPTHLLLVITFFSLTINAQIYKAKAGGTSLSFFSKAPMENISAITKSAIVVLNTATNIIQLRVSVRNFKFKNSFMQENFTEDFLETEKFPNAIFIGKRQNYNFETFKGIFLNDINLNCNCDFLRVFTL